MRLFRAAILLLTATVASAEHFSGTWTGTHETDYVYCDHLLSDGTAQLVITDFNQSISGTFAWEVEGTEGCNLTARETFNFTFEGSVSGNTFSAALTYPGEGVVGPLVGSLNGNVLNFVVAITGEAPFIILGTATRTGVTSPDIVVSAFPAGMIQTTGEATGTDSFSLTNNSGGSATVSLVTSGSFFTLSETTLTLAARATRVIGIQATPQSAQTAGVSTGQITGSGGVTFPPIRVVLLTAAPPSGTVRLIPPSARQETVAPAGQNPAGSVSFTNSGASAVQAIAVADVPWIVPQLGVITLAPGQPTAVQFQIDRSKRSDADGLVGGAAGKVSLRFLGSASAASTGVIAHATTPVSTVSVKIYDVVQPATSTRNPPPLGNGIAYFIAAFGAKNNTLTDLLLSNRSSTTGNLDFYFNSASLGSATQFLNLPQGVAPNSALIFPSMPKNVFNAAGHIGSLQIRGSSADLSVMAVQLTSTASGSHGTVLPVLRSDAAAAAGERVVLAGIERSTSVRTTIHVQEVGGLSGMIQADFLNAAGEVLVTQAPLQIGGFSALELDVVPAGAIVARISNLPGSNARIAAFALVVDDVTADAWVVSDLIRSRTPAPDSFVVPLVSLNGAVSKRDIYLTNVGESPITASFDAVASVTGRRRAIAHGDVAHPDAAASIAIGPLRTVAPEIPVANGYLRIGAAAGTMAASARVTASKTTGGSYGTGLAAIPTAAALGNGQSMRFTGVDDASAATVASATPGTFRSSLILIETAGQSATVRVTMNFSFASGPKVSGFAAPVKVLQIAAGQMITLAEIGRAVIGSQRDSFGDLSNAQIDVEVIGGSGRVVAVIQSIDNGSGDAIMR